MKSAQVSSVLTFLTPFVLLLLLAISLSLYLSQGHGDGDEIFDVGSVL